MKRKSDMAVEGELMESVKYMTTTQRIDNLIAERLLPGGTRLTSIP